MINFDESTKILLEKCNTFGLAFPYKNWNIKPFKIPDYYEFMYCSSILDIDKNSLGNIEFIQMSYLQFICKVLINSDTNEVTQQLSLLFRIALGNEGDIRIKIDDKGRYSLVVNNEIMTSRDFDMIRKIILYQNLKDYKDMTNVDPAIKKSIQEYNRIKNRDITPPSLEKKIASVIAHSGISRTEINDMTIRQFDVLFNTVIDEVEYTITQTGKLASYTIEDKIEHWVYKDEKSMYSDAFVSYDKTENKINKANA